MNATMVNTKENKEKILDFGCNFSKVAKENNWVSRYDLETDSLSFTKPKLSSSSRIIYLDNEIALYFNNRNEIEGIFIEYFKSNFIKHHNEFKEVLTEIDQKSKKEDSLVELEEMENSKLLPKFGKYIQSTLANDLIFQA